ncbi:MAG TPA: NAD(P)/FAD-dependent oxidoreductase [Candidatus Saccharimonadia bacterium]|nr:NAD(P)/FAD-dependent oxidoreductase [Candidatus Saccharimonadia bacterium]
MTAPRAVTIAGAGLAGSLLALLLARRGFAVTVYERRADPRVEGYVGGRSINLALAERGLHALRLAGVERDVLAQAVMMRGRMVHFDDGRTQLQRYGRDDSEVIWSVNRGRLNLTLLDAAERAGATIHYGIRLGTVDFAHQVVTLHDERDGQQREVQVETIIGCDGAGSALREAMAKETDLGERFEPLGHGYKELEIPPETGTVLERNALHIWPRTNYMCIALPNADGSFTVTLFLPNEGDPSFATVIDAAAAERLFARDFADAVPFMPTLAHDFTANPVGMLGTLRLERWHLDHRALLLGDAAHAIVPFHGQGMNCAFEDCVELDALAAGGDAWHDVYAAFEARRKPNADAIAAMALENYVEMRDRVDDPDFLLRRALERALAERHPETFVPRYAMVTFRRIPYAVAQSRGAVQAGILAELTRDASSLEQVDLERADALVRERLGPL